MYGTRRPFAAVSVHADMGWLQALFWINLPGVCISVVLIPFSMFTIHDYGPQLSSMTAVWLLPVVPACVAANTAGVVAQKVPEGDVGMSIVSIGKSQLDAFQHSACSA